MSFLAEYRQLPSQPPKTIRFFVSWLSSLRSFFLLLPFLAPTLLPQDRRDLLHVYGEDATFIATTFNRTTATLRYVGGDGDAQQPLASQSVVPRLLGAMLRRLVEMGWSFEVWAQEARGAEWAVVRLALFCCVRPFSLTGWEGEGLLGTFKRRARRKWPRGAWLRCSWAQEDKGLLLWGWPLWISWH